MRTNVAWVLVVVMGAGCSSLSNPLARMKPDYSLLPVEAMRTVAQEIETAVAKGERNPKIPNQGGIVVNTDDLRQAIRTRAARAALISSLLDTGFAYEDNHGLITILRTAAYKKSGTSQDRDRNAVAVISENQSRWALYEGIIKASHLSPKALGAVQAIFHSARVNVLKEGQKYQDKTGKIQVKGAGPVTAPTS